MLIAVPRHRIHTPLVTSRATPAGTRGSELGGREPPVPGLWMSNVQVRDVAPAVVHWKSSSTASMLRRMRTDFSISLLVTPA